MSSCDPKWKIPNSIVINVGAESVWNLISSPCYLKKIHPFLADNTCDEWSGVGSTDVIVYHSGRKLRRTITAWQDGVGFDIEAKPLIEDGSGGKTTIEIEWRIKPINENSCELETTIYPHRMKGRSGIKAYLFFWLKMKPMWVKYWQPIMQGFKYHLETGKIVTEDQFGAHPFFSAAKS
ncbi:MAG: SRPBCC family protein [Opitutales bacterium]